MEVIQEIRKQRGKALMTLSSGDVIRVPLGLLRERPLKEGDAIDPEEYDNWLMVRQYRYALDRAVSYLAARAHSRHEIEEKLLRIGYRPCTVEMVLYKLERERLLDDTDFARQWVESRSHRKLGRQRIALELRRKGVSADEAEAALSLLDPEALLEDATSLASKALQRAKRDEEPRKTASRIHAMLARRGFDWETAKAAVSAAMAEMDDDEFTDE